MRANNGLFLAGLAYRLNDRLSYQLNHELNHELTSFTRMYASHQAKT